MQLINKPTRICATCGSTIDHTYINATCASNLSTVILQKDIFDHLLLCVKYRCIPTIKTSQQPYTRSINPKEPGGGGGPKVPATTTIACSF